MCWIPDLSGDKASKSVSRPSVRTVSAKGSERIREPSWAGVAAFEKSHDDATAATRADRNRKVGVSDAGRIERVMGNGRDARRGSQDMESSNLEAIRRTPVQSTTWIGSGELAPIRALGNRRGILVLWKTRRGNPFPSMIRHPAVLHYIYCRKLLVGSMGILRTGVLGRFWNVLSSLVLEEMIQFDRCDAIVRRRSCWLRFEFRFEPPSRSFTLPTPRVHPGTNPRPGHRQP